MPDVIDPRRMPAERAEVTEVQFSPFLFVGLALRPLPRRPLQMLLSIVTRLMARRHPDVFQRLRGLGPSAIVIDATDLPFLFAFRPNAAGDKLRIVERDDDDTPAIARIRGPLGALLALLQGTQDGDALFFSRTLTIEGDMAAVLTLRNAIDGAADRPAGRLRRDLRPRRPIGRARPAPAPRPGGGPVARCRNPAGRPQCAIGG